METISYRKKERGQGGGRGGDGKFERIGNFAVAKGALLGMKEKENGKRKREVCQNTDRKKSL